MCVCERYACTHLASISMAAPPLRPRHSGLALTLSVRATLSMTSPGAMSNEEPSTRNSSTLCATARRNDDVISVTSSV